jgi:hypothetical protein
VGALPASEDVGAAHLDQPRATVAKPGKRQAAHELLAPVYGWFTEGFDTKDLQDAKSLVGKKIGAFAHLAMRNSCTSNARASTGTWDMCKHLTHKGFRQFVAGADLNCPLLSPTMVRGGLW